MPEPTSHYGAQTKARKAALDILYAADLRGTAYGVFNLVSGVAMLVASGLAGWLWDRYGAAMTFQAGAVFAVLALLGLGIRARKGPHPTL